jgi:SAM-dependent methyltransferase
MRGRDMVKCRICGADTVNVQNKKGKVFHFCPVCRFVSKDVADFPEETEEKRRYEEHNNSFEDPRYVAYFEKFIKQALTGFVEPGSKGLDFGSGPEPVLSKILMTGHGFDMDIYDKFYSPEKPYEQKTYDFITATEVVEHLQDPMEYFRLFNRLLKPGGILAVMTLMHHNDRDRFFKWHYIRDITHISFYCVETMKRIAGMTGFEMIYTDGIRYAVFGKMRELVGK